MLIFLSKVEHKMRISDEWCVFNYNDDVEYSSILVGTLQIYWLLNSKNSTKSEFGIVWICSILPNYNEIY